MKANQAVTVPTPESVWTILQETNRTLAETAQMQKEHDQKLKESRERFEQEMKESRADFDRRMKEMQKSIGSWGNNHGSFAEEYFFNAFENGQKNFFGEKFDEIERNLKGIEKGFKDEYDIVLINGKSVGIIEVKFKAREDVVSHVLRKAETFRVNHPKFKNHKVYLGLAALSFYENVEEECRREGIAVIKQVGDKVVIIDEELKVF